MRYFSIPCDFKYETIDFFNNLNQIYSDAKVHEVYGEITDPQALHSGRMTEVLPKINRESFLNYVRYASEKRIFFNYTLNPGCMGNYEFTKSGIDKIYELLSFLEYAEVRRITVSSPPLIEMIKNWFPFFEIKISAINEVNSVFKATNYKDISVNRIVVDPDITRDFNKLSEICRVFGEGVEIIVNNVCKKDCIYKMYHYNHDAHCVSEKNNQFIKDYYFNRCSMQKASKVENILKLNWIRPEDLVLYELCGIEYFKIQGRQNVLKGDVHKTVKAYFDKKFEGNLIDLLTLFAPYNAFQPYIDNAKLNGFIEMIFNNKIHCNGNCNSCGYCNKYLELCSDVNVTSNLNEKAIQFFQEYDRFTRYIKEEKKEI